jgi:hypothetical protein
MVGLRLMSAAAIFLSLAHQSDGRQKFVALVPAGIRYRGAARPVSASGLGALGLFGSRRSFCFWFMSAFGPKRTLSRFS